MCGVRSTVGGVSFPPLSHPALPCPECRLDKGVPKRGGKNRIGNRRSMCTTCNNFAQNVMRLTRKRLKEKHAQEYEQIRLQAEVDLYPQVIEDWIRAHPYLYPDD